jgi:diheme cytochrome c
MKRIRTAMIVLAAALAAPVLADESIWKWAVSLERSKEVRPVSLPRYAEECGSCHYAYPPGLLPEASWRSLLAPQALPDHFGENIEMKEAVRTELLDYAVRNAADHSPAKRSRRIVASLGERPAPLRITEISYIRRKHQRIPETQVKGNPKVNSLAMCDACHTQAGTGNLDDDSVVIPGQGRWRW